MGRVRQRERYRKGGRECEGKRVSKGRETDRERGGRETEGRETQRERGGGRGRDSEGGRERGGGEGEREGER